MVGMSSSWKSFQRSVGQEKVIDQADIGLARAFPVNKQE